MGINKKGEECKVNVFHLNAEAKKPAKFDRLAALNGKHSITELHQSVRDALERSAIDSDFIEELFEDRVIFWSGDQLFEVPYLIDSNDIATITGIPIPVERVVEFIPMTNQATGEAMKDLIINALKAAGVKTDGLSEDQLLAEYSKIQANAVPSGDTPTGDSANDADDDSPAAIIANAIKPLVDKIDGLEIKLNAAGDEELNRLAEIVGNSDKYPGIDADDAKKLGLEKVKAMAANCQFAFGLNPTIMTQNQDDRFKAPTAMPS